MLSENCIVNRMGKLYEKKYLSRYRLSQRTGIIRSTLFIWLNGKNIFEIASSRYDAGCFFNGKNFHMVFGVRRFGKEVRE